jgi:membrane-associated phospholipid phosphatase
LVAFGCASGFGLVYLVMVRTAAGQGADEGIFQLVFGLIPAGWPTELLISFARATSVVVLAAVALVLGVVAAGRRAWGSLLAAVLTTLGAMAGDAYLRGALSRPRFTDEAFPLNSLPSTHATAAAALTVALLLLWPRRWPWWLLNGAGVVLLLVALGNIVGQAHRPSDVAASFLLVGAVGGAAVALVGPRGRR